MNATRLYPTRGRAFRGIHRPWLTIPIGVVAFILGFAALAGVCIGFCWLVRAAVAAVFPAAATVKIDAYEYGLFAVVMLLLAAILPAQRGYSRKGISRGKRLTFLFFGAICTMHCLAAVFG